MTALHEVTVEDDAGIVMPDGCRLSARLWRPVGAGPVPLVLEHIPYRKRDGTLLRDEGMHPWVAARGYACLRVDMRGNGDSEGLMADEYTAQEWDDARQVIAWAAAQPWCSGAVGMMGKSWGGFNALQVAALRPPALRAVVSVCSTTDRFADDIHFKGGCLLGENAGWGATMLSYSSRPPDPLLRADWREAWTERLRAMPFLAPRWAAHQARDAYWRHGSIAEDWGAVEVPVLIVGGWADGYMNTVSKLLSNGRGLVKGLVGPWVHQYPHTAVPGPRIGFLQEMVRWWDRWLKGVPNGAEDDPMLRAFVLDSAPPDACAAARPGRWVASGWPVPGRVERRALSPGGILGGAGGALSVRVATPQHLGLRAGEFFPMGLNAEMPGDQAADDALSACFDAAPLGAPLTLLGTPRLRLTLESDAPHGRIVARLCDVASDGASVRIAHGMLNLAHRAGMERPSPVPVGETIEVGVPLDFCGYRLAAGHRLRVALSTSCWPFVWPARPGAGVTVRGGLLELPVAGDLPGWTPPPAAVAPPRGHRAVAPPRAARRIEHDLVTGTFALVVEDDTGLLENAAHGLTTGERMEERWEVHPDDPLSARAAFDWHQRLSRGGWAVRTRARMAVACDAQDLTFTARVEAWDGETLIHARDWSERVPRDWI